MRAWTLMIAGAATWIALAGIETTAAQQPPEKLPVVASFSILGDLVRAIGGDRVEVVTLVGPETDSHVYQPTPADTKRVKAAKLVFLNGLGFDGWGSRMTSAPELRAKVVDVSKGVSTLEAADHDDKHDKHGKAHKHDEELDPHAWQDIANVKVYVRNIRDALVKSDAAGQQHYERAAADYTARLDALDAEIKSTLARIPQDRRKVITHHDAFAYYGRAYGVTFLAPQGASGDSEPSARAVAQLIRQIRAENVRAVFVENIRQSRLIDQIARETGAKLGGKLYSDALSKPDGPASTYLDLMRYNTGLLVAAMTTN